MYRNCKKTSRAFEEEQLQMPENKITGTGRNRESVRFDRGGNEPLRESLSFSNILDDLFKLLFCVHVELHPGLHRGKLKREGARG